MGRGRSVLDAICACAHASAAAICSWPARTCTHTSSLFACMHADLLPWRSLLHVVLVWMRPEVQTPRSRVAESSAGRRSRRRRRWRGCVHAAVGHASFDGCMYHLIAQRCFACSLVEIHRLARGVVGRCTDVVPCRARITWWWCSWMRRRS